MGQDEAHFQGKAIDTYQLVGLKLTILLPSRI